MFYAYSTGLVADGTLPEDHYQQLAKLTDWGFYVHEIQLAYLLQIAHPYLG